MHSTRRLIRYRHQGQQEMEGEYRRKTQQEEGLVTDRMKAGTKFLKTSTANHK